MTTPRLLDFFTLEAGEIFARLESAAGLRGGPPDFRKLEAAARGLRGSATMARAKGIADLAGRLETVAGRLVRGELRPSEELRRVILSTIGTLEKLLGAVRSWSGTEDAQVRSALAAIEPHAPAGQSESEDPIVPISQLFYTDAGPHVLEVAASARIAFEQQLRARQGPSEAAPREIARRQTVREPASRSGLSGSALSDLLGSSIATMRSLEDSAEAQAPAAIVPIEALLYRGHRAVSRATELRAQARETSTPPSLELVAELCDLVELAATE